MSYSNDFIQFGILYVFCYSDWYWIYCCRKKTKTSTVSSKKEEEKKSQMLANKEKDFVKSLEHTLDKTKKENAVLKKQLHELELKVKQLEMEADFWKSKYNEIVDSMLKNSSSN
jgi:predicted RNase H-like nuclease (RuvC/YqgF family)